MEQSYNPAPGEFPQDRCGVEGDTALIWPVVSDGCRCHANVVSTAERHQNDAKHKSAAPVLGEPLSAQSITHRLCKARVSLGNQRRDMEPNAPLSASEQMILDVFPGKRERRRCRPRNRCGQASKEVALQTLERALCRAAGLSEEKRPLWYQRHLELVEKLQHPAAVEFHFHPFMSRAIPKSSGGWRIVTQASLMDSIVAGVAKDLLLIAVDPAMSSRSFAFRQPDPNRECTHHAAFGELASFRALHERLWIAETDIQAFFDSVDHQAVRAAVRLARARQQRTGGEIDHFALRVVEAMLEAYDFRGSVLSKEAELLSGRVGKIAWPDAALQDLYGSCDSKRFGIPQGLSLSPILANLVLDYADRRVEKVIATLEHPVLYIRYCDDIIVASPCRECCAAAWREYTAALARLKLPFHPADTAPPGKKAKSRSPHRLAPASEGGNPVVEFLGYSLGHDGVIGIRNSTIGKQIAAMEQQADDAFRRLRGLGKKQGAASFRIFNELGRNLARLAAGRKGIQQRRCRYRGWPSVFPLVHDQPTYRPILRQLDQHRHALMRAFIRVATRRFGIRFKGLKRWVFGRKIRFFGRPFSYDAAFHHANARASALLKNRETMLACRDDAIPSYASKTDALWPC